jgi:radical SAM superfamily enzyme YgiQ (UPF0313 family)
LLSIAANIKVVCRPVVVDFQVHRFTLESLANFAKKCAFLVLASSPNTFDEDKHIISAVKRQNSAITAIIFGPYSTFFPEKVLIHQEIDFVVVGDPEIPIQRLLASLKNKTTPELPLPPGIGGRINGKAVIQPREHLPNLDQLEFPDRQPILNLAYFNPLARTPKWTTSLTSRGCPGRCIFCTSPRFYGNVYRFMSVDWMINEIKYLKSLGFNEVFYRDETFSANRGRLIEFCRRLIREKLRIKWIANVRADMADLALLKLMKRSGCHTIKVGVESGSQAILDRLQKGITLRQVSALFRNSRKVGLFTHAHIIVGGPGENFNTLQETRLFLKHIRPTTVTFNLFTPYPGSPFFDSIKGDVCQDPAFELKFSQTLIKPLYSQRINKFPLRFLQTLVILMYKKFYFRLSYILDILQSLRSIQDFVRVARSAMNVLEFIGFSRGGNE